MFWRRRRTEEDFADEVRAHLDNEIERLVGDGMTREKAAQVAHRAFGNVTRARETFHESRRFVLLDQFFQDLRYAWRGLWHSWAFVATTVVTLAIGMGLVTAVFAIFNAYVLRPFAVHDPYSLYLVEWQAKEAAGSSFRWRDYEDFQSRTDLFDGVVAETRRSVTSGDRTLSVGFVSGNYFEALGPGITLGRGLVGSDARAPGSEPVAVLADQAWARLFGRDPAILGREIAMNGQRLVIVGVVAPEFTGMDESPRDAWVPITMHAALMSGADPFAPAERRVQVTARLRADVTPAQAQAAIALEPMETRVIGRLDSVSAQLMPRATPMRMTRGQFTVLAPIVVAFGLVLFAACANASNVMLGRACARHREIAIRLSIGASRGRVVRQLVTEGLLIAGLAGLLGLALASVLRQAGTYFFVVLLPPTIAARVRFVPFDFDSRVILFTMIVACGVTILFALVPALQATRVSLTDASRGRLAASIGGSTLRGLLVTAQVTVSLILLILATTLLRNGAAIRSTNVGMDTAGVIVVRGGNAGGLMRRAYDELSADPRVGAIAVASRAPLSGGGPAAPIHRPSGMIFPTYSFVSPQHFELFGIPIVHGRSFSAREAATEAPVAIISAAGARLMFPGEDPIGKTVRPHIEPPGPRVVADSIKTLRSAKDMDASATEYTIVGVAQDVVNNFVYQGIDSAHLYLPTIPSGARVAAVILRGRGALSAGAVRSLLLRISPDPQSFDVLPMDDMLALQLFPLRVASWIGSLLSGVALALGISGLYGVLSYTFAQRVREIGIRMALGASAGAVRRLVFRHAARLASVGTVLGLALAFTVMKLLSTVVHLDNVSVVDPWAFVAGFLLICLAVGLASSGPARNASRVDPSTMLRAD
jgi:predicted permease